MELTAMGLALGGNARAGLEDTLYLRKGELSPGNLPLVRRAVELASALDRVARLWIAFRDLDRRTGLNATQKMLSGDMWERVHAFRTYQTKVVPGTAPGRRVYDRDPDRGPARAQRGSR